MKHLTFRIITILFIITICISQVCAHGSQDLIPVKIGLLESYNISDSTTSQRYKDVYTSALYYAAGENEKKLKQCGYKFQILPNYFNNSDLLSAKKAAKNLEDNNMWIILGPVRSDQFIMATKGLASTAMISLMSSSNVVASLKSPYFIAAPGIEALVQAASKVVEKEKLGKSYGEFIDASCLECKDFAEKFDQTNDKKLKKMFTIDGISETPSLDKLMAQLKINKIDFLLLPNYSKMSSYIISQVHAIYPNIKFIGSDGWGQSDWSFFPGYGLPNDIIAMSIRTGLSNLDLENNYDIHSLDIGWKNEFLKPPYIAYVAIEVLRIIATDLCQLRPKNKYDFMRKLTQLNREHYRTIIPISVYKLKNSKLQFSYEVDMRK